MNDADKPVDSDEYDTIDPDDADASIVPPQNVDQNVGQDVMREADDGAVAPSGPPPTVDEFDTIVPEDADAPYDPHSTIESTELLDPFDTLEE